MVMGGKESIFPAHVRQYCFRFHIMIGSFFAGLPG